MDIPQIVYQFAYWRTFELVAYFAIMINKAVKIFMYQSFCGHILSFLGWIVPRNGMAESNDRYIF